MIKPVLFVLLVKGATLAMCEQSREDVCFLIVNSQNCFLSDVTDSNIWSKCKHLKLHLVCLCMFGNSCCKALSDPQTLHSSVKAQVIYCII